MNIFTHPRFRVGWLLIAVSTISSLGWTLVRWAYENTLTAAQITVDYDDTKTMADAYQVSHTALLKRLQQNGVSSVAIYQLSLANLRDNGLIVIQSRAEAEESYPNLNWKKYPLAYRYLVTANAGNSEMLPQIYEHLKEQAQPSLRPKILLLRASQLTDVKAGKKAQLPLSGLLIPASRQILYDARVGFDISQVATIKAAGLSVVARLPNTLNMNFDRLCHRLDEAKAVGAHLIIFAEDEVLGYQTLIPMVSRELKKRDMVFGAIEFSKQRGLEDMMKRSDGMLVRVHSVSGDEAAKAKREVLVERYVRAIKERNIRVAYVRLFPQFKGEWEIEPKVQASKEGMVQVAPDKAETALSILKKEDALTQNISIIQQISRELKRPPLPFATFLRPGMIMAEAQSFRDFPAAYLSRDRVDAEDSKILLYCMRFFGGLGAVGAFLLLLQLLCDISHRQHWMILMLGVIACAALAVSAGIGARLLALGVGTLMTPVALLWGGLADAWDTWRTEEADSPDSFAAEISRPAILRAGFSALICTSLLTLCGGLMTVALLNRWTYMSKADEYLGEKATQLFPLLLVSVIMAGKIFPRRVLQHGALAARQKAMAQVRSFLDSPFTVRYLVIGLGVLMAGFIWIARTGNDSGMDISPLELKMRAVLETTLITRPRTKELFIGNPALILAVYFAMKRRWSLFLGAALAATIGQADLYNTMCHIHTPLFYSLLRSFHAVWIGGILGWLAVIAFDFWMKHFVPRPPNNWKANESSNVSRVVKALPEPAGNKADDGAESPA